MAIAETAELIATLKLKDQMSRPAKGAENSVRGLERAAASGNKTLGRTETGMSRLGRSAGVFTSRMGTARKNLAGMLTGPLGMVGLGAGLFGLGSFFTGAISKAEEFGDASYRLGKLLHIPVEEASRMVDTLDKFGISGDAQIKILGIQIRQTQKYADAQAKARAALVKTFGKGADVEDTKKSGKALQAYTKYQEQFGLSVLDNKGKLVDSNELLKRSADYFNSNASASQKATVLQKIYGRGWQQLIPVLAIGRKGIEKEESTALHLSKEQIKNIAALRGAQREFNDTLGDTQTMAGLTILPLLTKIARVANSFLQNNQGNIVKAFQGAADAAVQIGNAINTTVIPAIKAIAGAWGALPEPLRNVLVGGFVANKLTGKIFGTSLVGIAKSVLGGAGGLLSGKGLFGRGNSPGSPLYVQAVGPGGLGGGPGGAAAGGGRSKLGTALGLLTIGASAFEVFQTWQDQNQRSTEQATEVQKQSQTWLKKQPSRADLLNGLTAVKQGIADIRSNPLLTLVQGDALTRLEGIQADIERQLASGPQETARQIAAAKASAAAIEQKVAGLYAPLLGIVPGLAGIAGAIAGISLGGLADGGSGRSASAPGGRNAPSKPTPLVGIEKNRGVHTHVSVKVNTTMSARENSRSTTVAARYGPSSSQAGAQ